MYYKYFIFDFYNSLKVIIKDKGYRDILLNLIFSFFQLLKII
jgi:hypothetical protein